MNILILSHTRKYSSFKIGSHHYANHLSINNNVTYIGSPLSLVHKILGKKEGGVNQLNDSVKYEKLTPLIPLSKQRFINFEKVNLFYDSIVKGSESISYDLVICDTPYFFSFIKKIKFSYLIYRPTDDYLKMDGANVISFEKDIIRISDAVIPTSEPVLKELIKRYGDGIKGKKVKVIENGYDKNIFSMKKNRCRKDAVYIGALDKRFDFETLTILATSFPGCKFNIYGPINRLNENEISKVKHFCENVIFHGAIDYNDIPDVLNDYKVGLLIMSDLPENKGRSPMKLWEYLSCGLNVVYSVLELNDENKKIKNIIRYNNHNELISAFNKAMTMNNEMSEAIELHSWGNKAKEMLDICQGELNVR